MRIGNAMKCGQCEAENARDRRFCSCCGEPLVIACAACGFANTPDAWFCGGCGLRSSAADEPVREGVAPGGSSEAVPGIEAEHKLVTVLFADIKSSLELIENLATEQARTVLDSALQVMIEVVQRHHGTVNHVLGDGIMALFGAPRAQEDHAIRACHAAQAILAGVKKLPDGRGSNPRHPLQIRVGISSGEVLVRVVRSNAALPYTAVGVTAHLAHRMEELARAGTAYLTEDTARLVRGQAKLTPIGPVSVRGLDRKVVAYELASVTDLTNRFRASMDRGLSQFVGRQRELRSLHEIFDLAAAGNGQVVTIVGQPGIGKSRLCHEFSRSEHLSEHLLLRAEAASHGTAIPWLLIARVLRAFFRLDDGDDIAEVQERVKSDLNDLDPKLL
ncbi:adenylate/guanylate cyclase domain-containing protein, partial [Pelagibius sp.]|uniref:adenylate/guanylate cyclase domain-containing protein n=1 Tax=Pelagibius sp. TaxID=1931238 RepID=UPI002607FFF1